MQAGLNCVAFNGESQGKGFCGGEKRAGGDCANGIPRYLFIRTGDDKGYVVVVPMTTPPSTVAVGNAPSVAQEE